jgi:hypothetical protein
LVIARMDRLERQQFIREQRVAARRQQGRTPKCVAESRRIEESAIKPIG